MLKTVTSIIRAKAATCTAGLSDMVDRFSQAIGEAARSANLGPCPSPRLVPVRVRPRVPMRTD